MAFLVVKYLVTAGIVVVVTEIAKRSDKLGALVIALPLMSILTLFWLYAEKQPSEKIANHAYYTFWYVLPTLPMFLAFPYLLRNFGFAAAMLVAVAGTGGLILFTAWLLGRYNISLL
ncbi:MAG: DUF3147 family protein [Spirochaetes bacterium]|nr:DUF3147 family protein [Spirochaetota bacterium]